MARIARRQHGVVTRRQLRERGFSARVIDRQVADGALHPVHRGVYLVGHRAAAALAHECAALLACAPAALLSHRTAARLWSLPVRCTGAIDVTVVGRHRRSMPGIAVHCMSRLQSGELRRHRGLPLTSPALTVLDIVGLGADDEAMKALNEARVRRIVTNSALLVTLDAHPNRRGAAFLRAHLASEHGPFATESEAERTCLALMSRHDLMPDATRARIGPFRVDFLYREQRLVVEVDGYRFHSTPERFVADRRRAAQLLAMGYRVMQLSWSDLVDRPDCSMRRLRQTLGRPESR